MTGDSAGRLIFEVSVPQYSASLQAETLIATVLPAPEGVDFCPPLRTLLLLLPPAPATTSAHSAMKVGVKQYIYSI